MSYAVNAGDAITQLAAQANAEISADGNSATLDLKGAVTANPSAAKNYDGQIAFLMDALNTAGTNPTLAVKLQHSDDDVTYTDVTGGGFTSLSGASQSSQQKVVVQANALKRYVQVNYDIGGTNTPKYFVSIQAAAFKRNPA